MKIRKGFVSNSSSSSFVCDVCGEEESGMDFCLCDVNMSMCEKGHTYCNNHTTKSTSNLTPEEKRDMVFKYHQEKSQKACVAEQLTEDSDYYEEDMPSFCCPCCQFDSITSEQIIEYMLSERKQTTEDVKKEIKEKYQNYEEMLKDIKK
jgi:uncharacterized membrane-anchored protein YhcB (DUF1043 family)